jgi:hypothetical protein
MKLRALSALLLSAIMLPLTGCIAGFTYDRGPRVPNVYLDYNAISGSNAVPEIVDFPANGIGAPSVLGDTPGSVVITAVATDKNGFIYAALYNAGAAEIIVFAPGSTGSTLPIRTFYSSTMTTQVQNLTVDPSGNVYVADFNGNLFKFGPGASGLTTPLLSLTGFNTGIGMTTDASGNLYLSVYQICPCSFSATSNSIYVYNAGFSTSTPSRIITPPALEYVDGLAVDASGNIYASAELISGTGAGHIEVYAAGATGSATPIRTISGSATLLAGTSATLGSDYNTLAIDGAGTLYVRSIGNLGLGALSTINEFPSTASGNVAPTVTIAAGLPSYYPNVEIAVY